MQQAALREVAHKVPQWWPLTALLALFIGAASSALVLCMLQGFSSSGTGPVSTLLSTVRVWWAVHVSHPAWFQWLDGLGLNVLDAKPALLASTAVGMLLCAAGVQKLPQLGSMQKVPPTQELRGESSRCCVGQWQP
eukprot:2179218-Lingulodinium_polyedra.AAC.1